MTQTATAHDRTPIGGRTPDAANPAGIVPMRSGLLAVALAAVLVPALLAAAGRVSPAWPSAGGAGAAATDVAAYAGLVGLAIGLAGAATRPACRTARRRRGRELRDLALGTAAPAVAGALIGAAAGATAGGLQFGRSTVDGLLLSLLACVAYGAAVGGAARAFGGDHQPRNAGLIGGACGGFVLWLAANSLRGAVSAADALQYWRSLGDPVRHEGFFPNGLGAVLPALCIPLGIVGVDALHRLWRR
ncbi:MAG: hypothetical protein R2755_00290 [Acidimicrobiales bacterium]